MTRAFRVDGGYPFYSQELSICYFSLHYQYSVNQAGDENTEIINQGIVFLQYQIPLTDMEIIVW